MFTEKASVPISRALIDITAINKGLSLTFLVYFLPVGKGQKGVQFLVLLRRVTVGEDFLLHDFLFLCLYQYSKRPTNACVSTINFGDGATCDIETRGRLIKLLQV